ncbi:MAG: sialate O-acetylesterase [Verrucomicrobia bacterium]|nr:sialate O-acetylesterase [Verrucomicrobiota bacterium]
MTSNSISTKLAALALAVLASGSLFAEVKPNPLFTDGAVLQRGQAVPVWGTARDGEKVTVEFGTQKVSTTAANGTWSVSLKPLTAGGPFTMKITGDNVVTVNNLLVGEVWVCSGQSNMEFKFSGTATAKEEAPKAAYPKIRMFTVTKKISIKPQTEAVGKWVECAPETVGGFSAVGYFFARDLFLKLGVPVGMIHTSWGGTPAQAWTSIEGFGNAPELKGYVDGAHAALASYSAADDNPAKQAEYLAAKKVWDENVGKAFNEATKTWTAAAAAAKAAGQPIPPKPAPSSPPPKAPANLKGSAGSPTVLYNGMIAPIIPYAIKGAIWYQGESNAGQAKQYRTLFPAMIADWRAKWKQGDFPFLFVQIAPFNGQPPEIREAQFLTLSQSKNTAMAVTTDVGNAGNIHPTQKEPVGQRLALAARALAYDDKIEYSGPLYASMTAQGSKITINFTHTGGGLVAKDGELKGFTIAAADGKFVPAKAEIKGNSVVVSADGVTDPKAVRYGWANVPDVNLFNKEGIPASPFRTDVD